MALADGIFNKELCELVSGDIPARCEQQAVVFHHPDVFVLVCSSVVGSRYLTFRIPVNIGDPLTIFGGGEHFRTEVVPVGIGAYGTLKVLAYDVSVVVAYYLVVLVDDENVPLSVHAIAPVVVGKGVVEAAGVVPADGVVDEVLGVVCRGGFEGNVRLNS